MDLTILQRRSVLVRRRPQPQPRLLVQAQPLAPRAVARVLHVTSLIIQLYSLLQLRSILSRRPLPLFLLLLRPYRLRPRFCHLSLLRAPLPHLHLHLRPPNPTVTEMPLELSSCALQASQSGLSSVKPIPCNFL